MGDGILSRGGKLCGICRECLVVFWITGTSEDLVRDEPGNFTGKRVSQGQEGDLNVMAERKWEGIEAG